MGLQLLIAVERLLFCMIAYKVNMVKIKYAYDSKTILIVLSDCMMLQHIESHWSTKQTTPRKVYTSFIYTTHA